MDVKGAKALSERLAEAARDVDRESGGSGARGATPSQGQGLKGTEIGQSFSRVERSIRFSTTCGDSPSE